MILVVVTVGRLFRSLSSPLTACLDVERFNAALSEALAS